MSTVDADAPLCLPPRPLTRAPDRLLPDGTVDTHFHVFRADATLTSPRSYTPQVRTIADWQAYARAVNIARGVLVQPSVYGFDNGVLVDALAADPANLRGMVVLPVGTEPALLHHLDQRGVRGIRVNTRNRGGLSFSAVAALAARTAEIGWILQLQVRSEQLDELAPLLVTIGCPVVLDHLGFLALDAADAERQVSQVQRLLDAPDVYTKLSAPYRLTRSTTHAAFGAAARRLLASHPERLLWGSDWPHTELFESVPDDADLIEQMHDWLGDASAARQVFVTNAETLFFSR